MYRIVVRWSFLKKGALAPEPEVDEVAERAKIRNRNKNTFCLTTAAAVVGRLGRSVNGWTFNDSGPKLPGPGPPPGPQVIRVDAVISHIWAKMTFAEPHRGILCGFARCRPQKASTRRQTIQQSIIIRISEGPMEGYEASVVSSASLGTLQAYGAKIYGR